MDFVSLEFAESTEKLSYLQRQLSWIADEANVFGYFLDLLGVCGYDRPVLQTKVMTTILDDGKMGECIFSN